MASSAPSAKVGEPASRPDTGHTAAAPSSRENKGASTFSTTSLAEALENHPLAKVPQQLLATDLRIRFSPADKEKLIQAAIERWKNADNASLLALATWLNGKGEFQRQLDTIPLERTLQTRELFLQHVDALGALGRWNEIRQLLESERFPLDPVVQQMYLARCYTQLGQEVASQNSWQRALERAGGEPAKLMILADYAEKNAATEIARRACEGALAAAPKLRPAWQLKLRLAQSARDTKEMHAILAQMLEIWPRDPAIQNDEAYTRLLLASAKDKGQRTKDEVEKSGGATAVPSSSGDVLTRDSQISTLEQVAQRLVHAEPASLPHRTLLALVYLKENRPFTALGVYDEITLLPNAATPSALAVRAAVLGATGNLEQAHAEASQIPATALLPEEAALLTNL